jgi:hypothetical protein
MFLSIIKKYVTKILLIIFAIYCIIIYLRGDLIFLINIATITIFLALIFELLIPLCKGQYNKVEKFVGIIFYSLLIFYLFLPIKYYLKINDIIYLLACCFVSYLFWLLLNFISEKNKNIKNVYFGISIFASLLILFINTTLSHKYLTIMINNSESIIIHNFIEIIDTLYSGFTKSDKNFAATLILGLLPIYICLVIKKDKGN